MTSRRQQILDTAAGLFAQRSFGAVTVDEIGAALGVSGPALYHHFDSKEALLGEMLVSVSERLVAGASELSGLAALIEFHCEFAVDNVDLIVVQTRDLIHASEADARTVRHLQNRYIGLFEDALRTEFAVDEAVASVAVRAVFGLINSTPHSGRVPRREMVPLLAAMTTGALAALVSSVAHPGG